MCAESRCLAFCRSGILDFYPSPCFLKHCPSSRSPRLSSRWLLPRSVLEALLLCAVPAVTAVALVEEAIAHRLTGRPANCFRQQMEDGSSSEERKPLVEALPPLRIGQLYQYIPGPSLRTLIIYGSRHSGNSNMREIRRKSILIVLGADRNSYRVASSGFEGWIQLSKELLSDQSVFKPLDSYRAYEDWSGNNYFFLNGRIMIGSHAVFFIACVVVMVLCSALTLYYIIREDFHSPVILVGPLSFPHLLACFPSCCKLLIEGFCSLYSPSSSSTLSPLGLQQHLSSQASYLTMLFRSRYFAFSSLAYFPFLQRLMETCNLMFVFRSLSAQARLPAGASTIAGDPLSWKYCPTCNIFRPPRSKHCRYCQNCVLGKFPFTASGIAKSSYPLLPCSMHGCHLYSLFSFSC